MLSIIGYIFLISNLPFVQLKHFLGGTISWKSMNNTDTNTIISIMFTQSYQWSASQTSCNQSHIYNLGNDTLSCVSNSTLCGGFLPLDIKGYCIDSSFYLDSRSSQISNVENITTNSKFCVAFQSIYWPTIQSALCGFNCSSNSSKWSIGSCVNLTIRSDGFINTPPVATVISPIRVSVNSSINITIPIIDADNDVIRCRWARNTLELDECGDICGVIPGSYLYNNNCTLIFNSTGKTVGNYYGVALMVEDFSNTSTNISLSGVPIQFLIEIVNASSCLLKPTISSNISYCTAIYVGVQFNFTLTITPGCQNTTIVDFFAMSPLNMYHNNLTQSETDNNTWNIIQTWIPTVEQLGTQVYCAVALDSYGIQSDQYCLTFNVVSVEQDLLCPGEVATTIVTTSIVTTAAAVSIQPIIRSVVASDISNTTSQFSNFDLALALGLSLPLLFIFSGLILYSCCCYKSKLASSISSRQHDALTTIDNTQTESNQKFANSNKENKDLPAQLPDYRQQYVNDGQKFQRNNQTNISNKKRPLTLKKSFTSKPTSDFDQNSINITKTTFLSPSMHSLGTNNASFTPGSTKSTKSADPGSILVRAYCNQENQKTIVN